MHGTKLTEIDCQLIHEMHSSSVAYHLSMLFNDFGLVFGLSEAAKKKSFTGCISAWLCNKLNELLVSRWCTRRLCRQMRSMDLQNYAISINWIRAALQFRKSRRLFSFACQTCICNGFGFWANILLVPYPAAVLKGSKDASALRWIRHWFRATDGFHFEFFSLYLFTVPILSR